MHIPKVLNPWSLIPHNFIQSNIGNLVSTLWEAHDLIWSMLKWMYFTKLSALLLQASEPLWWRKVKRLKVFQLRPFPIVGIWNTSSDVWLIPKMLDQRFPSQFKIWICHRSSIHTQHMFHVMYRTCTHNQSKPSASGNGLVLKSSRLLFYPSVSGCWPTRVDLLTHPIDPPKSFKGSFTPGKINSKRKQST